MATSLIKQSLKALGTLSCLMLCLIASAETLTLPPGLFSEDLLAVQHNTITPGAWTLRAGGAAAGSNNVAVLWDVNRTTIPAQTVTAQDVWARGGYGSWSSLSNGNWILATGTGNQQTYSGNHDAGQLWIDIHAKSRQLGDYAPQAEQRVVTACWYGVGHAWSAHYRGQSISGSIMGRYLVANNFLSRSITGQVEGEDFSGIVRTFESDTPTSALRGRGWSLDLRATTALGEHWQASAAIENLLGEMRWNGIPTYERFVTSPGVFTDADGFVHDFGGASGMNWREDLTLQLTPTYQLALTSSTYPNLLFGVIGNGRDGASPSLGMAWPRKSGWLPYFRLYPNETRLELGIIGRGWLFSIAGDDWLINAPERANLNISAPVLTF